jgi:hypothetical protein
MTFFEIPAPLEHCFDNRPNHIGPFIEKADRVKGHVIADGDGGFLVVSDYELRVRNVDPIYSAEAGFTYPFAA